MKRRTLYLISGPAGVGKSTIATALVKTMRNGALVPGDAFHDFHVRGAGLPWESEDELSLIWRNILSVSLNFLDVCDVVVDYVAFFKDALWLKKHLPKDVEMRYVVLKAADETLMKRDALRPEDHRMNKRSLILNREFSEDVKSQKHRLSTGLSKRLDLDSVIGAILDEPRFDFENND